MPVISLKPSYNSVIRGCPGIADTLPRIECQLRIRSNNGLEIRIAKMEIVLKSVETIFSHSQVSYAFTPLKSKGKSKKNESTVVHYKKSLYITHDPMQKEKTRAQRMSRPLVGVDLPLTIALPADINETNYNSRFGSCITYLECNLHYYDLEKTGPTPEGAVPEVKSFSTPVNVERYSNLPLKKLFPKIEKKAYSPDKKLVAHVQIENPCITTDDLLKVNIKLSQTASGGSFENDSVLFKKKPKLKGIVFEMKEVFQCQNEGLESKEYVLDTETKHYNEPITKNGIKVSNSIHICTKDVLFKEFESIMQEPELMYKLPKKPSENRPRQEIATKLLQSRSENVPFRYHSSVTAHGKLFSIGHAFEIKLRISGGKDFDISIPITITQWLKSQIKYVQQAILQERETAVFAKRFYENYGGLRKNSSGTIEYPSLPPIIYDKKDPDFGKKFSTIQYTTGSGKSHIKRLPVIE